MSRDYLTTTMKIPMFIAIDMTATKNFAGVQPPLQDLKEKKNKTRTYNFDKDVGVVVAFVHD